MNEEEYVNTLENELNKHGWQTWREVIPEECKYWDKPFRIDLIAFHKSIGYVGIEAKSISMQQGGLIAQAHKQIQKYRDKIYLGDKKIKLWAIAILFNHERASQELEVFIRQFFCAYGIGYIWKGYKGFKFDFGYSQPWAKILFDTREHSAVDVERIEQACLQKKGYLRPSYFNPSKTQDKQLI